MPMSAVPHSPGRRPWPLWPVAVAIVVCLAGYTYLRLAYAKPGRAHEPYAENLRRPQEKALAAAGWSRSTAAFADAIELPPIDAAMHAAALRPPAAEELRRLTSENWHLPIDYTVVSAPPRLDEGADLVIHIRAEVDQARVHIVDFDLFLKDGDIVAVPRWEPYPDELTPRSSGITGTITVPAAALAPGRHHFVLPALKQSIEWDLAVGPPPSA